MAKKARSFIDCCSKRSFDKYVLWSIDGSGKKRYTEKPSCIGLSIKDDPYLPESAAKFAGDMTTWPKIDYGHTFVYFSQKAATNAQVILDSDPCLLCIRSFLRLGFTWAFNTQHLTTSSCFLDGSFY